jgi:hypothetical protein
LPYLAKALFFPIYYGKAKELEKRSGSELKAIKKQLAKLAEMTGMKIVEEEVTASAPEETPPPAGWPVEAGKASDEEEVVPLKKKKGRPVSRRRSRAR